MLLCRSSVLLHRGMGDGQSPMSCLIICLVVAIIPRFSRFDKSFIFWQKLFLPESRTPQSRFALPFQGSFFDAAPQKPPLKGEGDRLRWRGSQWNEGKRVASRILINIKMYKMIVDTGESGCYHVTGLRCWLCPQGRSLDYVFRERRYL